MPKEGLTALAESYGLERNELHQLKILAESFFDKLREDLLSYAGRSIRMVELSQSTASFSDFATDPVAARHLVFLGFAAQTIAVIRLDDDLARALVDCMLGGADAKPSSPERKMSAVEERVIANTIGAAIVKTAQRVLGPILHDSVNIRLLRIQHRPGVVADTLPPSEQMVTARVRCDAGAKGGWIELGLPFTLIYKIRSGLTPARARITDAAASEHRARTLLADAALELSAVLGRVSLPLSGIRRLRPGSILMLQKTRRGLPSLELRCGEQPLFTGQIIQQDGWYRFLVDNTGGTDERANPDNSDP
jgi:flagellar motor switch protein FliM